MYSFLVLGLVPGTNIQISFQAWLYMAALLLLVVILLKSPLRRLLELGQASAPRLPLHANQLHQRNRLTAR
jgi:uncharacterized protein HemY